MYIEKPEAAKRLVLGLKRKSRRFSNVSVYIAPPAPLLGTVFALTGRSKAFSVCGQTLTGHTDPKHTGDISAAMLKAQGATHVIVGHSERRAIGESDELVRGQVERAQSAGLTAILCVGETERDPQGSHFGDIERQLTSALTGRSGQKLMVAYEPVWAIGKSAQEAMSPAQVQETVIFIRKVLADVVGRTQALKVPILYGGSVESSNAAALCKEGGTQGLLVGHASVDEEEFCALLQVLQK